MGGKRTWCGLVLVALPDQTPPPNSETIVAEARPDTLLIFDTATVVLEMGRAGKFRAKASGWEANRTILDGQKIALAEPKGRRALGDEPAALWVQISSWTKRTSSKRWLRPP
jgi:hypothetical protein